MPPDDEEDTQKPTTVDVLKYGRGEKAKYVTVPSGTGTMVVATHRRDASRSRLLRTVVFFALALAAGIVGTLYTDSVSVGVVAVLVVVAVGAAQEYVRVPPVPEIADEAVHAEKAEDRYSVEFHVEEPIKKAEKEDEEMAP
ncbi:MAG: hypothetical protein U5J64_00105 [Halobacteriales archaeon]|nr:hypothetical protein [Halobacteriales archaeon]